MSDRLRVTPDIVRRVGFVGVGLVAAGIGCLFSLHRGDPYYRLAKFLYDWTGLDQRVVNSTLDRVKAQSLSLPTIPEGPDDLKALGSLVEESLPHTIGGEIRPGRKVVPVIKRVLDLMS